MDDAIRKALEVAEKQPTKAAAIAAFLEALPQWAMLRGHDMPPIPGRLGIGTPSDIAAAVRRAAG
jgi:hypothetical protein